MVADKVFQKLAFKERDGKSRDRLREMILYVATKCAADPTFSAVRLNKVLWRADSLSYLQRGEPITGVEYMRLPQGPVPRAMLPVRDEMVQAGEIDIDKVPVYNYSREQVKAKRRPNLELFSARDIEIVDDAIRELWGLSANEASERTHGKAWQIAPDKMALPYQSVILSGEGVTPDDISEARALIKANHWHGI